LNSSAGERIEVVFRINFLGDRSTISKVFVIGIMQTEKEKKQNDQAVGFLKVAFDGSKTPELRFGYMAGHLINVMPLGVVAFDTELTITDINPSARGMLIPAENIADALSFGSNFDQEQTWHQRLQLALESSDPCVFENIAYANDGVNHILHIICTPLTEEVSNRHIGGILLIEDVADKVMMENDLASAERLAAMGKLAARVAHELNNPLDGILRYINLALRVADKNNSDQSVRYLQESRKGLQRMVQIIGELLEFSRSTYSAFEQTDLNDIVEDALKAMESPILEKKIQVERQYTSDLPHIRSGNLFQVFCNLIKNAADAMDQRGKLTIRTGCDEHYLLIEFADTGCGFSEETRKKLFEPFFTTKDAGKGTGLGLAICKDIVERYNGHICAQDRPGGGAVFTVSIPLGFATKNQIRRLRSG